MVCHFKTKLELPSRACLLCSPLHVKSHNRSKVLSLCLSKLLLLQDYTDANIENHYLRHFPPANYSGLFHTYAVITLSSTIVPPRLPSSILEWPLSLPSSRSAQSGQLPLVLLRFSSSAHHHPQTHLHTPYR